jgi:hypothetical protein
MINSDADIVWIVSIDIGSKNFSIYLEEMNKKELSSIENISKDKRYNDNGTPSVNMQQILEKVYKNGKTILHINADLTANCRKGKYLDTETFHNLTDLLDSYSEYWDKTSIFVIEQQMSFKNKINTAALKIGQHCFSYFAIKYGRFKPILEFPAFNKTCVLGAEKLNKGKYKNGNIKYKNIDKPQRKKWCIKQATEIMRMKGEDSILLHPKRGLKLDDYADTVCQLQAFKYMCFVDKSI